MATYRCDWCGRFYSSELPEPSACESHIPEHRRRLMLAIDKHNARLASKAPRERAEEA